MLTHFRSHRPSRRHFLTACLGAAAAAGVMYALPGRMRLSGLARVERTSAALGTDVSIVVFHHDRQLSEQAIASALEEVTCVERVMSLYQPDSELCRLNREGVLDDPHPYLMQVLREGVEAARLSDGAFDPTVQPLWEAYANAKRVGRLPTEAELQSIVRLVDWRGISIDGRRIRLREKGMAITLNGIAQGFATDRAMAVLKAAGIKHALVNAGEIAPLGQKAGDSTWRVGIQHPREKDAYIGVAALDGRCISTSGDYETTFSGDFASNHIFDPATGRSPGALSSVSVAAPTATQADALSTAIFVLGPVKGLSLVDSTPQTDAMLVLNDGQTLMTRGFPLQQAKEGGNELA